MIPLKFRLLIIFIVFLPLLTFSQPISIAPVDGGLSFLILAGIVYGVFKLRKEREL